MDAEKKIATPNKVKISVKDAKAKFLEAKLAEAKLQVPCDICSSVQMNVYCTITLTSKVKIRMKDSVQSMFVCSKCMRKLIPEDNGRWDIAFYSKTRATKLIDISIDDLETLESITSNGQAYAVYRPVALTNIVESIADLDESQMSKLFRKRHEYKFRKHPMILSSHSLMSLSKHCLSHITRIFGSKGLVYRLNRRAFDLCEASYQSKIVIKVVRDLFFISGLADIILGYFSHAVEIVFCNEEIKRLSQRQIRICAELKQNTIKAKETMFRLENLVETRCVSNKTQIGEFKSKKRKRPNTPIEMGTRCPTKSNTKKQPSINLIQPVIQPLTQPLIQPLTQPLIQPSTQPKRVRR